MTGHDHLHRRHARNAFPNPFAWASAAANALASPFAEANPVQTMVSVVYITASPTFDGPIGGYTTLGAAPSTTTEAPEPTTTPDPQPDNSSAVVADSSSAPEKHASSSANVDTSLATSTDMPSSIAKPSTSVASSIALLAATTGISSSHTTAKVSATSAAASASASASSSSGGMSAAGKAGMAIGIILLLGAVLSLVLFCFKKRRDAAKHDRLDDEKTPDMFAGAGRQASTRTTATAPRLSLRPVTQFLPYLGGEKRQSRGNALAMTAAPMSAQSEKRSAWERPMNGQDANRNNPFGNHAETIDATNANGPAVVQGMGPGGEILAGAVAAGAAAGLARGASKRGNGPKPMDFTKNGPFKGPPSPAPTEFSETAEFPGTPAQTNTGAAIAAAGGPPNSTVHRVQLDFKPSMEDELELRAGQLIRLLHEYDDGWALCIRLDRSQQGVVPRTCLSTRPVKPRPQQNGPRGPPPPGMRVPQQQPRPMSPAMNQGPRPMSPAGNRPMTPNGSPAGNRPMTPTGGPQRPMTPNGQQGRPRSPSAAQMQGRRNSPPGPSRMNPVTGSDGANSPPDARGPPQGAVGRKPVPGQAM